MNITARYVEALGPQITERDKAIIQTVSRFKLATGEQLERLYFADCAESSRARGRQAVLARLTSHHVLAQVGHEHTDTKQPRSIGGVRGGSHGYVYSLGTAGHYLAAASDARPRRKLTWYEPAMAHLLAVTELYVRLVETDRAGTLQLIRFEAEPECWRQFEGRTLKPDAFMEFDVGRGPWPFFVEVDRANQYGTKISTKLPQYQSYHEYERMRHEQGGFFPSILFVAPTSQRVDYLKRLIGNDPKARRLFRVMLFDDFPRLFSV